MGHLSLQDGRTHILPSHLPTRIYPHTYHRPHGMLCMLDHHQNLHDHLSLHTCPSILGQVDRWALPNQYWQILSRYRFDSLFNGLYHPCSTALGSCQDEIDLWAKDCCYLYLQHRLRVRPHLEPVAQRITNTGLESELPQYFKSSKHKDTQPIPENSLSSSPWPWCGPTSKFTWLSLLVRISLIPQTHHANHPQVVLLCSVRSSANSFQAFPQAIQPIPAMASATPATPAPARVLSRCKGPAARETSSRLSRDNVGTILWTTMRSAYQAPKTSIPSPGRASCSRVNNT